ncbi:flavin monoamine oxidase family protein [Hyalangium minutum]|uniref:Tryptophan 2-monooxygenase n=1 Tax=Hyalangium minutum TaxID=394096 RepID=A0A085WX08_9BACT|nr:NAD(P)/FAD-dependent oxidoreductase [Hyalangium minutum]KFE72221.1 Amine oxidase [flavin-containing] A [Hyalangium minutum]
MSLNNELPENPMQAATGTRLGIWAALLLVVPAGCVSATASTAPTSRALLSRPPAVADCEKTTGYDAIIVGAGFSGLTASKELRRGGRDNVLILEATDRIGGRASTLKKGPPIDLGGAWIHGVTINPLTPLADALGFERVTSVLDGPIYLDNGKEVTVLSGAQAQQYSQEEEAFYQRLLVSSLIQLGLKECRDTAAMRQAPRDPDREEICQHMEKVANDQVSHYLPQDSDFRHLFEGNIGPLESAVETSQNSTVDAVAFEAGDDDLIKQGMGNLIEAFGKEEPVCLNSPVTKITYTDDGVVVDVKNGKRYQARKALVTVSIGVLQAKKIQFEPPLPPSKLAAIEGLPMGNMQKVIIDFKDQPDFMGDTLPNSWVLYQAPDNSVMAFVIRPLGKNIAIGFYGGERAKQYEQQCASISGDKPLPPERQPCDEAAVQHAKAALVRMYHSNASTAAGASAPLDIGQAVDKADIYLTRWSLEPWVLGAYSAAMPGAWPLREKLGESICSYQPSSQQEPAEEGCTKRLYFGGEATGRPMYNGSFAGAHEAGLRTAREMLHALEEEDRATAPANVGSAEAGRGK